MNVVIKGNHVVDGGWMLGGKVGELGDMQAKNWIGQ